jgi:hypothetical protein
MMAMFLTPDELAELTGRRVKSKQIEVLRRMGVPFRVNACGKPIVATCVIEGSKLPPPVAAKPVWRIPK